MSRSLILGSRRRGKATIGGGGGGSTPTPGVGATYILDTRAGGAADLQAVTTWAAARSTMQSQLGTTIDNDSFLSGTPGTGGLGWNFTTDFDGLGTNALRSDMVGYGDRASNGYTKEDIPYEGGNKLLMYVTGDPKETWVQWKTWMGRTATGGGFDDATRPSVVGRFAVCNEETINQNASRKYMLVSRNDGSGNYLSNGRYDFIFAGTITTKTTGTGTVSTSGSTATFSSSQTDLVGKLIRVSATWDLYEVMSGSGTTYTIARRYDPNTPIATYTSESFDIMTKRAGGNPEINNNVTTGLNGIPASDKNYYSSLGLNFGDYTNQVVTWTAQVKAASTLTGTDGRCRMWLNDVVVVDTDADPAIGLPQWGNQGMIAFEILGTTFQKPRFTQTEYFWDIIIWKP